MSKTISPQSTVLNGVDFRKGERLTRPHAPGTRSHHTEPKRHLGVTATIGSWGTKNADHRPISQLKEYGRRRRNFALGALGIVGLLPVAVVGSKYLLDDSDGSSCTGIQEVTIHQGDTIWDIATDIPGYTSTVQEDIIERNPGIDPEKLQPGQVIEAPISC